MKLLSWDVGIYNLSYCILEKIDNNVKIIKWDIINLVDNDEMKKIEHYFLKIYQGN